MAETVYKDIPDLSAASVPLDGTEYIEVSATGTTGKAQVQQAFGSGWWTWLKAAFSAFKAPDSDHADDADTVGGELPASLHDATQLTGAVPLASIPEDLTSKYATADGGNADTVGGYSVGVGTGVLNPYHGYLHGTYTDAQVYSELSPILPGVNDECPINGGYFSSTGNVIAIYSRAKRTSSTQITLYGIFFNSSGAIGGVVEVVLSSSASTSRSVSITY